jgi:hypothetical protein
MNILFRTIYIFFLAFLFIGVSRQTVWAQGTITNAEKNAAVQSNSVGLAVKIAPGELLPISVKILNFGGGKRVDVTITYLITSEKNVEVYRATETVAVETTNSFVKTIQIPSDTAPGVYMAKTSILYKGQETPATTQFSFRVDRKILGLFQNEFLLYGGGTLLFSLLMAVIGYSLIRHRASSRFGPIDYSHIPHNERVFYELISDTVLGMRQKVGDRALDIASRVEGLTIDEETGRIVKLTRSPSKIIAELVLGYEKTLGEKVSFSFRDKTT